MITGIYWLDISVLVIGLIWSLLILWDMRPEKQKDHTEEEE